MKGYTCMHTEMDAFDYIKEQTYPISKSTLLKWYNVVTSKN